MGNLKIYDWDRERNFDRIFNVDQSPALEREGDIDAFCLSCEHIEHLLATTNPTETKQYIPRILDRLDAIRKTIGVID